MRYHVLPVVLIALLAPLPGHAQERRAAWLRAEAGPGKVDWWDQAGVFLQVGLSFAGSETSALAIDLKVLDGVGGDGGGNSEGFVFALIGPEVRFHPESQVSPFIAAHGGIGYDQDGGMVALTGEAGLSLRTSRRTAVRLTGLTDAGLDAWSVSFGLSARL